MQEYIGISILVPLNIILWLRVGFSVGHRRSQAWVAVTLLTVMWAIHLAVFDQTKTATSMGLNAVVFAVISLHRWREDSPDTPFARWCVRQKWLPKIPDDK